MNMSPINEMLSPGSVALTVFVTGMYLGGKTEPTTGTALD